MVGFLSGCASSSVGGHVQAGRHALLANDPEQALRYFQQAALKDPNYRFESGHFREGVWTYVGRAQYHAGRLQEARQAFERALTLDKEDHLARLYLGLILARLGNGSDALREIQSGLKGLHGLLEYIDSYSSKGPYWDPARQIRSEIEKILATISGRDVDWPGLIERVERIGYKMEEEIDLARRDRMRDRRERDRRPGVSIELGF